MSYPAVHDASYDSQGDTNRTFDIITSPSKLYSIFVY